MPTYNLSFKLSENSLITFVDIENLLIKNNATFTKYLPYSYIINYTYLAGVLGKEIKKLPFNKEDRFFLIKVLDNYDGILDSDTFEGIKNSFNK